MPATAAYAGWLLSSGQTLGSREPTPWALHDVEEPWGSEHRKRDCVLRCVGSDYAATGRRGQILS